MTTSWSKEILWLLAASSNRAMAALASRAFSAVMLESTDAGIDGIGYCAKPTGSQNAMPVTCAPQACATDMA